MKFEYSNINISGLNSGVLIKVLWLSRFFSNYQFVSFRGCFLKFWWFKQSRFNVFIFLSLCQPVSCYCQQKNQGAALGGAVGAFFAFIFQTQHSYLLYSKREMKYVNVILFRIACYKIKIQKCPPKDIFEKFERKAHNHSTLNFSDFLKFLGLTNFIRHLTSCSWAASGNP